jgi:electron transport complex protein RnfE
MSDVKTAISRPESMTAFVRPLWEQNPVLVTTLGMCPTLAVTNAVANSLAMGIATTFVLVASCLFASLLRKWIPHQVRISAYVLIIATFVTVADMMLEASVPDIHRALGAYIALIVVNCIILGRQEAFASRNPVGPAVLDALGNGFGFTIALLLMGIPRELLGSGSLLGVDVMGPSFEPWVIMVLPPGGFLIFGCLLLGVSWWNRRQVQAERRRVRERLGVPA